MQRAVAHPVKAHAEHDASKAPDPSPGNQRRHEVRAIATLHKSAGKLRAAMTTTTKCLGTKRTPIKRRWKNRAG